MTVPTTLEDGSIVYPAIDDSSISALMEKRYGWVHVDGRLLVCDQYNHLESILQFFPHLMESLKSFREQIDHERAEWLINLEPDEHPAWHVLDIAQDGEESRLKKTFYDEIYQEGWARIGIRYRYNRNKVILEALHYECPDARVNAIRPLTRRIAAKIGVNAIHDSFKC